MTRRDIRPTIFRNAIEHPALGNTERLFLIVLVHLAAEYIDGRRRPGSHGMNSAGNFALHYDYLGRALHTSAGNAKKLAQRLEAKGFLSKRWPGTFGRPAGYQALDVRGDNTYRITLRDFVPPYEVGDPTTRGDKVSPLTYKTPDLGDPEPAVRVSRQSRGEVQAAGEEARVRVVGRPSGCEWHEHTTCPDDCANHPANREASA